MAASAQGLPPGGIGSAAAVHRLGRGPLAADDLHQRDQMRRIERMAQHEALRMAAPRLHGGGQQGRAAAGDDRVGWHGGADLLEQRDLQVEALRAVFLHPSSPLDRGGRIRVEAQA